jgi:hypothetical protein
MRTPPGYTVIGEKVCHGLAKVNRVSLRLLQLDAATRPKNTVNIRRVQRKRLQLLSLLPLPMLHNLADPRGIAEQCHRFD